MIPQEMTIIGVDAVSSGTTRVRLSGRLGWDTEPSVRQRLTLELGDSWSSGEILLDLGDVRFLDSAGISALLTLRRELADHGGKLSLCEVPPRLQEMFELVGMYRLIPVVDPTETAPEGVPS